jgi:hypothetical protein
MTEGLMNEAIGEACGWKGRWNPCYSSDLDAMHAAEKVLEAAQSWNGEEHHSCAEEAYMGHLTDIIVRESKLKIGDDWLFVTASARQRAEAFLRMMGKWEEEE